MANRFRSVLVIATVLISSIAQCLAAPASSPQDLEFRHSNDSDSFAAPMADVIDVAPLQPNIAAFIRLEPVSLQRIGGIPFPRTDFSMDLAARDRAGQKARATIDFEATVPLIHLNVIPGTTVIRENGDSTVVTIKTSASARRGIRKWPSVFVVVLDRTGIESLDSWRPEKAFRLVRNRTFSASGDIILDTIPVARQHVKSMRIRFWLGPDSIANETRATNDSLTRASGSWGVSGTVSFSGRSITTSTGNLKITCYNCWGSLSANLFVDARWSWFSIDACARVSASARANIDLRADFRSGIAKTPRYRFFSLPIHRYGLAGIASIDPFIFGDISASTYLYSSTPLWATYGFDASAGVTGVVKLLGSNKCGSSSGSASVNSHGFKKSAIKIAWSGNVEMQLMPGVGVKVSLFGRGPEATIGPELYLGLGSRYSAYCPSRTSYAIYGGVDLQLQKKDVLNLLYKRFTNWLCW